MKTQLVHLRNFKVKIFTVSMVSVVPKCNVFGYCQLLIKFCSDVDEMDQTGLT